MTTIGTSFSCTEILFEPYKMGFAQIENSLDDSRFASIYTIDELVWAVAEKIACFVMGVLFCIPLINSLLFIGLKTVNSVFGNSTRSYTPLLRGSQDRRKDVPPLEDTRINNTHSVDLTHLAIDTAQNENIPDPPLEVKDTSGTMREVRIQGLNDFSGCLNFTNQSGEGYRKPSTIKDDGILIQSNPTLLRTDINQRILMIINRIRTRAHFLGVPSDRVEKERYYEKLEKLVKHIVKYLYECQDLDIINSTIIDLAVMSSHCGGRYMSEAHRLYSQLKCGGNDPENMTIEGKVLAAFSRLRNSIFLKLTNQTDNPHSYGRYLKAIGKELGIPGANAGDYDDPYGGAPITVQEQGELIRSFHGFYTPSKVHSAAYDVFNGSEEDPMTIPLEVALAWFRENIPSTFKEAHSKGLEKEQNDSLKIRVESRSKIDALEGQLLSYSNEYIPFIKELYCDLNRALEAEETKNKAFEIFSTDEETKNHHSLSIDTIDRRSRMLFAPQSNPTQIQALEKMGITTDQWNDIRPILVNYKNTRAILATFNSNATMDVDSALGDLYISEEVLQDLGEGKGQAIRSSAVLYFLEKTGFLLPKTLQEGIGCDPQY